MLTCRGPLTASRRQCSCSRNQPWTASPATTNSSMRPSPSWAALQGCLLRLCPSLLNGMSVCPSTANTEGLATVSSMPEWMRPQVLWVWLAWMNPSGQEGGNHDCPTRLGFSHCQQALVGPGAAFRAGARPLPFPHMPSSPSCLLPTPRLAPSHSHSESVTLFRGIWRRDSGGDGR